MGVCVCYCKTQKKYDNQRKLMYILKKTWNVCSFIEKCKKILNKKVKYKNLFRLTMFWALLSKKNEHNINNNELNTIEVLWLNHYPIPKMADIIHLVSLWWQSNLIQRTLTETEKNLNHFQTQSEKWQFSTKDIYFTAQ